MMKNWIVTAKQVNFPLKMKTDRTTLVNIDVAHAMTLLDHRIGLK